jgi:hypothetical protein
LIFSGYFALSRNFYAARAAGGFVFTALLSLPFDDLGLSASF